MQVFASKERLGKLTQTGNSTVQLSSSVITLGAKQYTSGNLTCDISSSGAGGLDTGMEQSGKYYYVYAIVDTGSMALVCSLSEQGPTGYSHYKKVGAFVNNYSGDIEQPLNIGEQPDSEVRLRTQSSQGSVNTQIARWDNIVNIKGIEIELTQDVNDGDSLQVKSTGMYFISYAIGSDVGGNTDVGISINSTELNTPVENINPADRLNYAIAIGSACTSTNGWKAELNENDIVRVHKDGQTPQFPDRCYFSITKTGKNEIDWRNY